MPLPSFLAPPPSPLLSPPRRRHHRPFVCRTRVPNDATTAAGHIRDCVRRALIAGRLRLCVDVLTAAVDPRARIFDPAAAAVLVRALVHALQPVLPPAQPLLRVVVPGPATALRVTQWLADAQLSDVSVAVLGVQEDPQAAQPDAFVVLDPPVKGDAVLDFRRLLQFANKQTIPVIVHNHPRQDALYAMLGYRGHIPFELTKFEPAFVLAPFALQSKQSPDPAHPQSPPPRFVVLRKYPDKWALWRFVGPRPRDLRPPETDPVEMEQIDDYRLCEEFDSRPTDNELVQAVQRDLRRC